MIETRRLKNVVIFIQTILNFVLSRKLALIVSDIPDVFLVSIATNVSKCFECFF